MTKQKSWKLSNHMVTQIECKTSELVLDLSNNAKPVQRLSKNRQLPIQMAKQA